MLKIVFLQEYLLYKNDNWSFISRYQSDDSLDDTSEYVSKKNPERNLIFSDKYFIPNTTPIQVQPGNLPSIKQKIWIKSSKFEIL